MIAPQPSRTSTRSASLLWLACGFGLAVACSNQITYSRIDVNSADGSSDVHLGTGGAGPLGTGGVAGTGGAAGAGGADAGIDTTTGIGDAGGAGVGGAGVGGAGTGGAIGTGGAGMGGAGTGGAGMGGAGGGALVDVTQFNFESSTQGWMTLAPLTGIASMTAQRFTGMASLGATLTYTPAAGGTGVTQELWINPAAGIGPVAGNVVTFHVFLPANAAGVVGWVQPYVQDGAAAQTFTGAYTPATALAFGGWTTIALTLPTTTVAPIFKMAVQFFTSGTVAFSDNIYVDSIGW